jgi:putative DNA primase/helicase
MATCRTCGCDPCVNPSFCATCERTTADNHGSSGPSDDEEIARLAKLSLLQYDRERKEAADRLKIRAPILDRLVEGERAKVGGDDGKQGRAISFPEPEPWPNSVAGSALLDAIAKAIGDYVIMPEHSRNAATLWVVHSYLLDRGLVSPRLAIRSPTKRCGKTTLLDVLGCLVLRPLPTASVTPAAIFRVVEAYRPAVLVDEADTFLRDNDELRGVINSGHRRGGSVLRTVGDDHEPRAFSTYSACAIALIGKLPDTLHDRSVVIDLKRRLPSEEVKSFRPDRVDHLNVLARQISRWAQDHAATVAASDPEMPAGIYNREADNWRPLLAVANAAGGEWPVRARKAIAESHAAEDDEGSRLELLLGDIRNIFTEQKVARITSLDLVESLKEIEGRPWAEYGKSRKPISQNQLARLLKGPGLAIAPDVLRAGEKRGRGYLLSQFTEAFERYLSPEGGAQPCSRDKCDEMGTSGPSPTVTLENDVTVEKCEKSNNDGLCHAVTVQKGGTGEEAHIPPGNGGVPGMSGRTIDAYAEWYSDCAHRDQRGGGLDTDRLDAELRQKLAERVLPEYVETEFKRVIEAVFRT